MPNAPVARSAWRRRLPLLLFGGYWLVLIVVVLLTWTRFPGLEHGDWYSDANTLNVGRHYDRHGMGHHGGLPHPFSLSEQPATRLPYVTYPPLPDWLHQLQKGIGLRAIQQWRAVSIVVSALGVLLFVLVVRQLTGDNRIAAFAGVFYTANAAFLGYVDNLRYRTYSQFVLFAALATWLAYERAETAALRRRWLTLTAVLFALSAWLALETALVLGLFAFLRTLWQPQRRRWVALIILGLVTVASHGLRLGHAVWGVGDAQAVLAEFRSKGTERIGATNDAPGLLDVWQAWQRRLGGGSEPALHHSREFLFPILATPVLLVLSISLGLSLVHWPTARFDTLRRGIGQVPPLLAGGLLWLIVMQQHAVVHRHLALLLAPGLSLLLAVAAVAGLAQRREDVANRHPPTWFGPLLTLLLLLAFVWPLRSSIFANQFFVLDPRARAIVERRREAAQELRNVGPALDMFDRIWIAIPGLAPRRAYLLGQDFELVNTKSPAEIAPDEALLLEAWSAADKRRVLTAVATLGFPKLRPGDRELFLLFRGTPVLGASIGVMFGDLLELTRVHVEPTTDPVLHTICAELRGDVAALNPRNFVLGVSLLAPDESISLTRNFHLEWTIRDDDQLLVTIQVPSSTLAASEWIRFGLWSKSQAAFVPARTPTAAEVPASIRVSDAGLVFWRRPAVAAN